MRDIKAPYHTVPSPNCFAPFLYHIDVHPYPGPLFLLRMHFHRVGYARLPARTLTLTSHITLCKRVPGRANRRFERCACGVRRFCASWEVLSRRALVPHSFIIDSCFSRRVARRGETGTAEGNPPQAWKLFAGLLGQDQGMSAYRGNLENTWYLGYITHRYVCFYNCMQDG
jgi:hypothetical protein